MDKKLPIYKFSPEKNLQLKTERDICFEEIIAAIANGKLLDVIKHENPDKYLNQMIYVVLVKNYTYLVPFVDDIEGNVFLKTIIPSRKAKKKYLKEE